MTLEKQKLIGLDYVLNRLNTMTPYGEALKRKLPVYYPGEEAALMKEYEETGKCYDLIQTQALKGVANVFCLFKDIAGSVAKLSTDQVLDEVEFFEIKLFAAYSQRLNETLSGMDLDIHLEDLSPVSRLLDPEGTKLLTFHFYDAYSEKLKALRQEKYRWDQRRQEPGYEEAVFSISQAIQEEIWGIREQLTQALTPWQPAFEANMKAIGILDFRLAKADYALRYGAVQPCLSQGEELIFEAFINPMVDGHLKDKGRAMEPLELTLRPGSSVLTGANMGGKSVTLKSIVLVMELFRRGCYLPGKAFSLRLPHFVFFGGEEGQDVKKGLSSFGWEVLAWNDMLAQTDRGWGLIVLDEPARGTNPREAQAIVKGLLNHFKDRDDYFLVASHLPNLAEAGMGHYQIMGLKKLLDDAMKGWTGKEPREALASLEQNMDYRIGEVSPQADVPQEALHVMEYLGANPDLLAQIKRIVGDDHE